MRLQQKGHEEGWLNRDSCLTTQNGHMLHHGMLWHQHRLFLVISRHAVIPLPVSWPRPSKRLFTSL
jgi:hypothetical protein